MTLTISQKRRLAVSDQDTVDVYFTQACRNGEMEDIIYLCFSQELQYRANISSQNYEGFRLACRNNHLEVVKFLTQSHRHAKPLKVNGEKNLGKEYAARNTNVEILDYLHNDPQLILEKNNTTYTYNEARDLFYNYYTSSPYEINDRTLKAANWALNLDVIQTNLKVKANKKTFIWNLLDNIYYRRWSQNQSSLEKIMTYLLQDAGLGIDYDFIKHHFNTALKEHTYVSEEDKKFTFNVMTSICNILREKDELSTLIDNVMDSKMAPEEETSSSVVDPISAKPKHNKI